jgi:hypothetical protein
MEYGWGEERELWGEGFVGHYWGLFEIVEFGGGRRGG